MSLTKVSYSMINGAPVNILDFGADSTGSVDSTVAIQTAINTGFDVFIPNGTFLVNSTLHYHSIFQTIYGLGFNSILSFQGSGIGLIIGASDGTALEHCVLRDLQITAGSSITKTISIPSNQVKIWRNRINTTANTTHALYYEDENDASNIYEFETQIIGNRIVGPLTSSGSATGSYGIRGGLYFNASLIKDNEIGGFDILVLLNSATPQCLIQGNSFEPSVTAAISLDGGQPTAQFINIGIKDNYFEDNPVSIKLGDGWFNDIVIDNNYSYPHQQTSSIFYWAAGTAYAGSSNITVKNNYIDGAKYAFQLDDEYSSRLIDTSGNSIKNESGTNVYANGTYANNAYRVRVVNPFFEGIITAGSALTNSVLRMEYAPSSTVYVPIRVDLQEQLSSIQVLVVPNSSNTITLALYSQQNAGVTTTLIQSIGPLSTEQTVVFNGLLPIQGLNYYIEITTSSASVSTYVFPFQLFVY